MKRKVVDEIINDESMDGDMNDENKLTDEEIEKIDKLAETQGYKCPKCGNIVPYFIIYGKANYAVCPICKKKVSPHLYPPEAYVHLSGKKDDSKIEESIRKWKEGDFSYDEDVQSVQLIDTPKKPEEVLEEVLSDLGVNRKFIELAVKRSKRVGGLHPSELEKLLLTIKFSGVKDKGTAEYIASEYMYALQEEKKKAERLGENIFYPIGLNMEEPHDTGFTSYGSYDYGGGFMARHEKYYGRTQENQQNVYNPAEIVRSVADALVTLKGNNNSEDVRVELERLKAENHNQIMEMIMQFQQQMTQMMQQFQQTVLNLKEEQRKREEELKAELEKQRMEFMQQRIEDQMRLFQETIDKYEKSIGEMREFYERQIQMMKETFEKEIQELKTKTSESYKEDSYRLLSDAIHHASEVIREKEPIKEIARIASKSEVEGEKYIPKKKVKSKENIEDLINPEYVEEGE